MWTTLFILTPLGVLACIACELGRGAPHLQPHHCLPHQAKYRQLGYLPTLRAIHGQDGQHLSAHQGQW